LMQSNFINQMSINMKNFFDPLLKVLIIPI